MDRPEQADRVAVVGCATSSDDLEDGGEDAACEQYLDCVAVATPDELGAKETEFGQQSDCWADTASAERCAEACDAALTDLQGTVVLDNACWPAGQAVFAEGRWDQHLEALGDSTSEVELTSTGPATFTITDDNGRMHPCTLDGMDFECEGEDEPFFGAFSDPYTAAYEAESLLGWVAIDLTFASPL